MRRIIKNNLKRGFKYEIKKAFILYALTPITIITLLFYNLLFIGFMRMEKGHNKNVNDIVSRSIEKDFESYKKDTLELSSNKDIINILLENDSISNSVYENIYDRVNEKDIKSIVYIYDKDGNIILTNSVNGYEDDNNSSLYGWGKFGKMRMYPDKVAMMIDKEQINVNTRTVYTIGKAIKYKNEIIGFVTFNILENELNKVINLNSDNDVVVTDKYSNNIINTNSSLLDSIGKLKKINESDKIDHAENIIINGDIYVHTLKHVGLIRSFFIYGEVFLIVIFIILFKLMIYYGNKISVNKTKSIDILLDAIVKAKNGDLDNRVSINTNDEFQVIGEYYNEMIEEIQSLMKKNEEEVKRATLAQIKHLESQFNPHFLFNTLEMLKYMIKAKDSKAENLTLSMSRILRYSLDNKTRSTYLIEDIKYIEDYLSIQKLRFEDKFDYDIYIEKDCEKVIIPKLIIQPIVENSIKYGFGNKDYLIINIFVEKKNEDVKIYITDNGDGIKKEDLEEIRQTIKSKNNYSEHIGIYNVQKRLSLIYGDNYGIDIVSEEGMGTCSIIKIPIKEGGKNYD